MAAKDMVRGVPTVISKDENGEEIKRMTGFDQEKLHLMAKEA